MHRSRKTRTRMAFVLPGTCLIALTLFGAGPGVAQDFTWDCVDTNPDPALGANPPTVSVENVGSGHEVRWTCEAEDDAAAVGTFKSYEVRYRGESQNLVFGASYPSWIDDITGHHALADYTARCDASAYEVRAVTRKSKGRTLASQWVATSGGWVGGSVPDYCGPTGGGGNDGGGSDGGSGDGGSDGGGGELVCSDVIDTLGSVSDLVGSGPTVPSCGGQIAPMPLPAQDFTLAWEDEFDYADGAALARGPNFNTAQPWGAATITNGEWQYYVDEGRGERIPGWSPFAFGDDGTGNRVLAIQAAPYDLLDAPAPATAADYAPKFASGIITTFGKHSIKPPAYVEIRARMPYGRGTYPALWLLDERLTGGDGELDIVEYIGQSYDVESASWSTPEFGNPGTWETLYHTYHDGRGGSYQTWTNSNPSDSAEWCGAAVRFPDEFHTFGILYTAEEVVWYVDGIQTMRMKPRRGGVGEAEMSLRKMPTASMYFVANLALNISWFKHAPDASTCEHFDVNGENQVNLAIDYVRVYEKR